MTRLQRLLVDTMRTEMILRGVSQGQLARRIGCSQVHISRILSGHGCASVAMFGRIFDELDIDVPETFVPDHWQMEENSS